MLLNCVGSACMPRAPPLDLMNYGGESPEIDIEIIMKDSTRCLLFIPLLLTNVDISAQEWHEPVDLFSDSPALGDGFFRLGAWNVRHIDLALGAEGFLVGNDREADFEILTRSYAKAIEDLKLDIVVLIEVQPRDNERSRFEQVVAHLNNKDNDSWACFQSQIEYDDPKDPYGNLQFGLIWNRQHGINIDPAKALLLEELRQPRDRDGNLIKKDQRTPWLIPVEVHASSEETLAFDLVSVHLKSGGTTPQSAEVYALADFIRQHQSATPRRHLILCGDWNIRPDQDIQGRGRPRLKKLSVPISGGSLMRILTVGDIAPTLDQWQRFDDRLGSLDRFKPLADLLPHTHIDLREDGFNTLLDHIAISRTLDELFDNPVRVKLATGQSDVRPGIEIVQSVLSPEKYFHFTDHYPVVITLPVKGGTTNESDAITGQVRIVAAEPNPLGDESKFEEVHLKNVTEETIDLNGWTLRDASGSTWKIGVEDDRLQVMRDGKLFRYRTVVIKRNGRAMALKNSGDTISLFDEQGRLVDTKSYGRAASGKLLKLE